MPSGAQQGAATTTCECDIYLKRRFAELGVEANVSPWRADLKPTRYDELHMRCPHGIRWHAEPTTDQVAEWVREGVS